jgi:hypothetical protein
VKFLIYVAPDGYIAEIFGPYFSNGVHNDEWLHYEAIKILKRQSFFLYSELKMKFCLTRGSKDVRKSLLFMSLV